MREEPEIVNAKITSTMLGPEDHDITTFYLMLEWPGGGQGIGGFALDQWSEETESRSVGIGAGIIAIRRILDTVGVRKWEDLTGKLIRVKCFGLGSSRPPIIGNILDDKWFDLKEFMEAESKKLHPQEPPNDR